jgi:hypothetical protein
LSFASIAEVNSIGLAECDALGDPSSHGGIGDLERNAQVLGSSEFGKCRLFSVQRHESAPSEYLCDLFPQGFYNMIGAMGIRKRPIGVVTSVTIACVACERQGH